MDLPKVVGRLMSRSEVNFLALSGVGQALL